MELALLFLTLLGLSLGATVARSPPSDGDPSWDITKPLNGITFERVRAVSDPTPDRTTLLFSRLKNIKGQPGQQSAVSAIGRATRGCGTSAATKHQNITTAGEYSTQYAVECGWDGAPVWLLFDTGSADTWAARAGFRCKDSSGHVHPQSDCGLARPYIKGFVHGAIPDVHFYLKYGSGETVSGPMGYSDISCGGVSVSRQQVGLANSTYWQGNNATSGILGLAYPSITSAYYGKVGAEAPWNAFTYTPFLTSAIAQGSIDPVFSVALLKNSSDGVLAWGGLPPTLQWDRDAVAVTDLLIANLIDQDDTAWRYSFYTIVPDGLKWGQTTNMASYPYIVDTGTTMTYLPPPLAQTIAQAFEPSAVYLYQWGTYFAPCDAIAPQFAVIIGGKEFWINPADMMYRDLVDPLTGYCAIAIASGGAGPYILGDMFLQNVLAVFDVGGAKMRFYPRY